MSTISNNFSFSKEWTDADDFPTKEYSEPQVRADIQQLFDELKDYINNVVVAGINDNASSIAALGGGGQVDTDSLADDCVTAEKIKDGEITELKYADDSIPYRALQEECVHNINIQDGAVTAEKLGDSAVTTAKLDNGSVTVDKMATNSVSAAKILDNAVITSKINNGAVTADKLASNSVTTAKIVDGNVTAAKLGDGSVVAGKLGNSAVATANLADGSVTEPKLASNSVTTAKITDLNVTTGKLANNAVTTAKIADGNVTAAKLASNSVTTAKITNGNVTAEKLDSSTVDPYVNGLIDAKATALAPVRGVKGNSESSYRTGQVNITKANIGLGSVENKSASTILGELTSSQVSSALGYDPVSGAKVYNVSGGKYQTGINYVNDPYYSSTVIYADYYNGNTFSNGANVECYMESGETPEVRVKGTLLSATATSSSASGDIGASTRRWATVYCSSVNQSSDRRLKEDIDYDSWAYSKLVDSLKPCSFKYKSDEEGRTHVGFIAQDVDASMKALGLDSRGIIEGSEENYYGLNYSEIIAMLVAKVQDLQKQLNDLKGDG